MRRIGVDSHLVGAERILLAQADGKNELITAAHLPESLEDFAIVARFLLEAATGLGVPPQDTVVVHRPAADAADQLRRAPARPVGAAELVALRRRRQPLAAVPEVPRRGPDAHAGGGAGARDERPHRRLDPAAADLRPHARRRPRRPRARRPDQRRLDRPVGGAPRGPGRRRSSARRRSRASDQRRADRERDRGRADRHRRPLRRRRPGRDHAAAGRARAAGRRAAPQAPRQARHPLDERRDVLPRRGRAARARPRPLHRLRVGADLDLPAPVLARLRLRPDRRRQGGGGPLGRRLGLVDAQPAARQGRHAVHPRRGARGGVGAARRPRRGPRQGQRAARLPRPGDRVPEPDAGRQPRAAAGQHRRLVGGPAGRGDADPEPVPRLRLRAHAHRPGHDGGRQRGGAARGQRHPRGHRLERAAVRDLAAARAARCSRPPRRSTSCAGSSSTARPSRRCG